MSWLRRLLDHILGHRHRFRMDRIVAIRDVTPDSGLQFEMPTATYDVRYVCPCGEVLTQSERGYF
jgi:hypothetical protein